MANDGASGNAGSSGEAPGSLPYYEKSRQHLKELLQKRRQLERQLSTREDAIYQKETDYLDSTPSGNIVTGFDNYTKGTTGAAAQRRKTGLTETNRVFSRSSISYNSNNVDAQTPGSTASTSHAPTPMSSSFKETASNHPTPTSATAPKSAVSVKNKKKAAAAAAAAAAANNDVDSETDGKETTKKVRTNLGVVKNK